MDDVICEVETDKTSVPVPSPVKGKLQKYLLEDGAVVEPGTKILEMPTIVASVNKQPTQTGSRRKCFCS